VQVAGVDQDPRLGLAEFLLSNVDVQTSARRAIDWLPWSAEGRLLLGESRLAAGDTAAARASLRRAVERDRGDWRAWYLLAAASRGTKADAALERAAALNPRSPDVAELRAGN